MTREMVKQIECDYWREKESPIDMAEIFDLAQKALEQDPSNSENPNKSENPTGSTTKNDLGVDCIDRQAAITFVCKNTKEILKDTLSLEVKLSDDYLYENVAKIMRNPKVLPSVTPQPRKGHWMGGSYDYVCSNCEHSLNDLAQSMDYIPFSKPKYCPNCGAKMVEPQESEVKE